MLFSANLGFLWTDRSLPEAIRAAAAAGFDAVECHWPYDTPAAALRAALDETGLPLLSLNTRPGDSFGLTARPGSETAARAAIDEAVAYAVEVGAGWVHVMAGTGGDAATFAANLRHACTRAEAFGLGVLIEPINPVDVPGYHLTTTEQAAEVIAALDCPNLRMMFDCYHVARTGAPTTDAVAARFAAVRPLVGHVQIAAVPDRGAPDHGTIDYAALLPGLNWTHPVGAEYRPSGATGDSLGWMRRLRA